MIFFCSSSRLCLRLCLPALAVVTNFLACHGVSFTADLSNTSIPWDNLIDQLSADDILNAASNQDYYDQCYDLAFETSLSGEIFDWVNQPAGVCMAHMFCGFKDCLPVKRNQILSPADNLGAPGDDFQRNSEEWLAFLLGDEGQKLMDPRNTLYEIPSTVLFPQVVGDVVAAITFAGDNGIELSVKASGHHFTGASTKKGTLLVNTARFKRYSSTGIVECTDIAELLELANNATMNQDLSNQACLLALARKKNAYIRVGGGENWSDVYISVVAHNDLGASKYHAMGGAAPTVTPMGWTFQGGLGGTQGGRLYGFGVDQVLQIEAVLPNGQHVRFGPSSWEEEEEYLYPRTTVVSGVCNSSPEKDEADWMWDTCPMDINFDDLWFAFRGGGGGTWGIVTSMYLQLHDHVPMEVLFFDKFTVEEACNIPTEEFSRGIEYEVYSFALDYLFDPISIGVSLEESRACGKPSDGYMFCFGEGTGVKFASTWETHILNMKEELMDKNISETSIESAANCLLTDWSLRTDLTGNAGGFGGYNVIPGPFDSLFETQPILVPASYYRSNKQSLIERQSKQYEESGVFTEYCSSGICTFFAKSYGAHTPNLEDQTSSLSKSHRNAAFMLFATKDFVPEFLAAYNITSDDTTIPAYIGANHYISNIYGPLKSDPTKACNLDELTQEEVDEKCFSIQAAVWGSENLARLEAIKKEIDPNHIFDCNTCVGNSRTISSKPPLDSGEATSEITTSNNTGTTDPTESVPLSEVNNTSDIAETVGVENDSTVADTSSAYGTCRSLLFPLFICMILYIS